MALSKAAQAAQAEEENSDSTIVVIDRGKTNTFIDRILEAEDAKNEANARLKGIYDDAEREGIDRKALKVAVKHLKNPTAARVRQTANSYLEGYGSLPLFAGLEPVDPLH